MEKSNKSDQPEIKHVIPAWRINQIIRIAMKMILDAGLLDSDFDLETMIKKNAIRIKKFSDFNPENLSKLKKLSLSFRADGLCLIFPDEQTGNQCKLISYDDEKSEEEIATIILHEFGHIVLKHTEQSIIGEMEAICFVSVIICLIELNKQLHIGQILEAQSLKDVFLQNLRKEDL